MQRRPIASGCSGLARSAASLTAISLMNVVRRRGHPRFPSKTAFLRTWKKASPKPIGRSDYLERFAASGAFTLPPPYPELPPVLFNGVACAGELARCGSGLTLNAVRRAFDDDPSWLDLWRQVIAFLRWGLHLEFASHAAALHCFKRGERSQHIATIAFHEAVWILASCYVLVGKRLANDCSFFIDAGEYGSRRAQYFCLRLISSWFGRERHRRWPVFVLDEPVYETLLTLWRTRSATLSASVADYLRSAHSGGATGYVGVISRL